MWSKSLVPNGVSQSGKKEKSGEKQGADRTVESVQMDVVPSSRRDAWMARRRQVERLEGRSRGGKGRGQVWPSMQVI